MKEGLWKLGVLKDEESVLTPIPPASLSDASNIREVILDFKNSYSGIPPFLSYGSVAYSLNYFLTSFGKLRRVDLILPRTNLSISGLPNLEREDKVDEGIKMANARLGVPAKLSSILALHIKDGIDASVDQWSQWLELGDEWFWQAEEGLLLKAPALKPARPPPYENMPHISGLLVD
jgi:hypothetical protein